MVDITNIERRVEDAAQAPGRVEPQLRATLDMIPAYAWCANPSGGLSYVNRRQADFLGLPKDHPLRLGVDIGAEWDSHISLVHPDDHEEARRVWSTCLRTGSPGQMGFRVRNAEGRYRWFLTRAEPVRASDGTLLYWIGVNLDIEDQKQAEFYLAQGQRLAHTGSSAHNLETGKIHYWSEETYRIWGLDPQQQPPDRSMMLKMVHPEDRDLMYEQYLNAVRNEKGYDHQFRIVQPAGAVRHIHVVGHPVFSASGELIEYVCTHVDITEQEEMIQELRRREAYLTEAQRLSHTGSFGWNYGATGELTWSEETYRINGLDRSIKPTLELVRKRVHPDDLPLWLRAFAQASEGKQVDFEHRYLMPDGSVKNLHVVAHGVHKDGKFVELVGTLRDITEHKRAEETIRRSEAYLADAQKLSRTGSWAWSPEAGIKYWSEECYRVQGFDPRDGLPRFEELFQRIHPDDQPRLKELMQRAVREKIEFETDFRLVFPDGAVRDIHSTGHPVLGPSGDLIELMGTVIDITERKRAEEELRASEAKYRHLVDTTPGFVHTALPNGDLDFFNRGWLGYFGLPITDLLGWRWTAVIHPEDVEEMLSKWRASLESGRPFVAESRVRRADGQYRWFLHRKQPQRNEAGEIVKWYGLSIEIEERKIAEEAIRRGEAFLAEGQRLSHTGSWGWNASSGKVTWSQEHFRILGLDPDDTNPSLDMFWERVHPDDRTALQRTFESALKEKRDFDQEFRIVTPDGSIRHLHGVAHAVLNRANELVEFIGTTMDITERKRADAALQEARAELERVTRVTTMGELAASIAHEVNQPLAGVVTSANAGLNWLAANPPNLSKTREALERVLRDGTRGGEVLARIRALLKRTPPAKTIVNVNHAVRDVLALFSGDLRQHRIELSLELAPILPPIRGDNIQLQQVLVNLIKNAVEAMAGIANGQRTLRIQSCVGELDRKPAVVIEVSDTGAGLSGPEAARLFEAFHTTKPQGMGMGLWISRSIIEGHGGRLSASSKDGSGAVFVIKLPTENPGQT